MYNTFYMDDKDCRYNNDRYDNYYNDWGYKHTLEREKDRLAEEFYAIASKQHNQNNKHIELIQLFQQAIEHLQNREISEIEAANDYIDRLKDDIKSLKHDLKAAKDAKTKAERKLAIFLKSVVNLVSIDKLKDEARKVIQQQKDHRNFSQFFGIQTAKLQDYEEELKDSDFD